MSAIVFAAPVATTPPVVAARDANEYSMYWTGADGVTWDLNNWRSGVYLASGVQGIAHAPIERWTLDSPAVAGSLFGGARTLARAVQWPIVITSQPASGSWRDLCRRWWKGWSKTTPGTWQIMDSNGQSKRLILRHNPAGDFTLNTDPGILPWVPWTVDAVADSPYWRGDQITRVFEAPKQYYFFGGGDPSATPAPTQAAPPFYVSKSSNLSTASIANPGDVPASPMLRIDGPFSEWSVTINGGTISGPAVADGDWWDVSTDLTYPVATGNSAGDVTKLLTAYDPRPIPPSDVDDDGELVEAPISILATGQGKITLTLTPLYEMGF